MQQAREITFNEVVDNQRVIVWTATPLSRTEPSALGFWVAANLPQKKLSSNQLGVWDGRAWSADREWCKSVTDVTAAQPQPQTHLPHSLTEFGRRGEVNGSAPPQKDGTRLVWRYTAVAQS